MYLQPKNRKYIKEQKSPIKKGCFQMRTNCLVFGCYGLKYIGSSGHAHLTAAHCEAVRRVIVRKMKKLHKIYVRIFCTKPITKKPTKTRMGKGKGSVNQWVCPIKPGQILFEINGGISNEVAKEILKRASKKLPIMTKIVRRASFN